MDAKIGQIVETLEQLGIREDTLLIFTRNNGLAKEADLGGLVAVCIANDRLPRAASSKSGPPRAWIFEES